MAILSAEPPVTPLRVVRNDASAESKPQEVVMHLSRRTSVSYDELEALAEAVERATFLNGSSSRSSSGAQLLDPSCLLDALSDVYAASLNLVRESGRLAEDLPHSW